MLKNYRKKLDDIESNLVSMVENIIKSNKCMLEAIKSKNYEMDDCQNRLKSIDETVQKVDNSVLSTLALFSPEAKDLRELVAILKIINEISRAKSNIQKYGLEVQQALIKGILEESLIDKVMTLQECSIKSFEYVSMMISSNDDELSQKLYNAVIAEEDKADEIFSIIDQAMVGGSEQTEHFSLEKINSLKSIRKLEKVTDRAVGIAELIMFAQTGGEL